MDNITLSEQLMERGWWDDALRVIDRADVPPADKTLQTAALTCRRECVKHLLTLDIENLQAASIQYLLSKYFDKYTVHWTLNKYIGVGSLVWGKRDGENAQTD